MSKRYWLTFIVALVVTSLYIGYSYTPSLPSIPQITSSAGMGSGVVIGSTPDNWLVVTANHCTIEDRLIVRVGPDKKSVRRYTAPSTVEVEIKKILLEYVLVDGVRGQIIQRHPTADLALIQVPREREYRVLSLADARQGEPVTIRAWAWCDEGARLVEYTGSVVSTRWTGGYVAVNSGAYPGCSGGPVMDTGGRVVGVVSRYETLRGQLAESTVLCVPSAAVKEILNDYTIKCVNK